MRQIFLMTLTALWALFCIHSSAGAWGTEEFGNKPLNYQGTPQLAAVINHESRVYHRWVNGNEQFFYRGNSESLNDALKNFAATDAEVHEIVLRPGPAVGYSFNKERTIKYNWEIHMIGGIAKHVGRKRLGEKIWDQNCHAMMVYVGGDIQLEKIEIPENVKVFEIADFEKPLLEGLRSPKNSARSLHVLELGKLDPHNTNNMNAIANLIDDEDLGVRWNAVKTLALFGKKAEPLLPSLRSALKTGHESLHDRIRKTIAEIEGAKDMAAAVQRHQQIRAEISQFCQSRNN